MQPQLVEKIIFKKFLQKILKFYLYGVDGEAKSFSDDKS